MLTDDKVEEFVKKRDEYLAGFSASIYDTHEVDEATCLDDTGRYRIKDLPAEKLPELSKLIENNNKEVFKYLRCNSLGKSTLLVGITLKRAQKELQDFAKTNNLEFYSRDKLEQDIAELKETL
ncbi:MAG: hypothetical protein MJ149_01010 [Clostridia bacterium]|nr:hypothetical protein [Clostridia bacterium]